VQVHDAAEWIWVGFVLFMGSLVAARYVRQRALSLLSAAQKVRLVDALSTQGTRQLLLVVVLLLVTMTVVRRVPHGGRVILGVMMLVVVGNCVARWRKLRSLGFPAAYLRATMIADVIPFAGVLGLLALL
jgi:hypothetical protein